MAIQEFEVTVLSKEYLTKDVVEFSFSLPETFSFKAGQFIMLKLFKGEVSKLKSYSILNPPSKKGQLNLCIKIIDGGFASEVFRILKIGEKVLLRGPFGHFTYKNETTTKESWFIGTGTGLAPLYSMIHEHLLQTSKTFRLFFGVRTMEDLFYVDLFKELEKKYSNFYFTPTITRETWNGHTGRVQTLFGENLQDIDFYICGLKDMVFETEQYLLQHGVPAEYIHYERYN